MRPQKKPLVGATVFVLNEERGTATDEQGRFQLNDLNNGRYQLLITHVGYQAQEVADLIITGQVLNVTLALEKSILNLDTLFIVDRPTLSIPGKVLINEEQVNRFAATYYDPARLVTSVPDIAVANDQNNQISLRGVSPAYNTWRLEGAEILNPNHLSNAGTFTDRPTANGGGVNMISAQMLSSSNLLYGNHGSEFGNFQGGLFDMELKEGNKEQIQWTTQASLIGLDVAADGRFSENSPATFAANYRYSFTGLLTNFGVDFGGESIGFQDLSMSVNLPVGQRSELKLFAVGGASFNEFEHKPFEESERYKDRQDISYRNRTGIVGGRLSSTYSKMSVSHSLAASVVDNKYQVSLYTDRDNRYLRSTENLTELLISAHSKVDYQLNRGSIQGGLMTNVYKREIYDQFLLRPYLSWRGKLSRQVIFDLGTAYSITPDDQQIEPRFELQYAVSRVESLKLGVGRYSQLLNHYNYIFDNPSGRTFNREEYPFQNSMRYTLTYEAEKRGFINSYNFFLYYFDEVRVNDFSFRPTDGVAIAEDPAIAYGITWMTERNFDNNYYFRLGATWLNSEIGDKSTQYDLGYSANASLGKSWDFSNGMKNRELGINMRTLAQGGQYFNRFDGWWFDEDDRYQTADYFRADLRLTWTKQNNGRTTTWALDIQNVTNRENEAYRYFDQFTGQRETQYQLGMIPILSWKTAW